MGVQIIELLKTHPIQIESLANKRIAVDASNHLYQFLTTIRAPDGTCFSDSHGNITSHLIGLFSRTANLMQKKLKLIYVFDGKAPDLKHKELEYRKEAKREAEALYQRALSMDDLESMKKYAGRFSRLSKEMIDESKKLIGALGLPCIDAPSEAEAQAAFIVKNMGAYAVSSQDADSLLFGAPRIIRNLSITGKRKKPGKHIYESISPELIDLEESLNELQISREQLIALGVLVGTDYNPGGIKGIGPKKALQMVKKHNSDFNALFEEVKWNEHSETPWQDIIYLFKNIPISKEYKLEWMMPDKEKIVHLLCEMHDFSRERVEKTVDSIITSQKGLDEFFNF